MQAEAVASFDSKCFKLNIFYRTLFSLLLVKIAALKFSPLKIKVKLGENRTYTIRLHSFESRLLVLFSRILALRKCLFTNK